MWKAGLLLFVLCPLVSATCDGCGDYVDVSVNDTEMQAVANNAMKSFSNGIFSKYRYKIVEITEAKQSLCSNEKLCGKTASFKLNLTMGRTNCLRKDVSYEAAQDCEVPDTKYNQYCKVSVGRNRNGRINSTSTSCSSSH